MFGECRRAHKKFSKSTDFVRNIGTRLGNIHGNETLGRTAGKREAFTALQGFFLRVGPSWMLAWHTLPETNITLKIGHAKRKRESIPTIHFQVQTVSLPEGTSQNPKHDEFQSCLVNSIPRFLGNISEVFLSEFSPEK